MNRRSAAISHEPRSDSIRQGSDDQTIAVEGALFAITVAMSILALLYYMYINSP